MARSIKRNFIYNSISNVLLLLFPLLSTPYLSRVLGAEGIGRYSFSNSIVVYFVVISNFGSSLFGQKTIASYRDNKAKLSEVFWNVISFRFISCILFLAMYFLFLSVTNSIDMLFYIMALNIVNVFADITWFYQGLEEFEKTISINLIFKVTFLISVFCLIKSENDLLLYALINCGLLVIGNLLLWIPIRRYIDKPIRLMPFKNLREMFILFLPTIATQVYTVLDKSMIGWITKSDYSNGCYEESEKIARTALGLVTSIGAVILPRIANLFQKGDFESIRYYIYKAVRIVWALSLPLMFGTVAVSSFFIPIFLGDGFELSVILLQIFSLLIMFVSIAYIIGLSYLIPTCQQNIYTIAVSTSALINLIMNLILIPTFGAIGAAIASVTAELLGVSIQIGYCVMKKQLSLKGLFNSSIKYYIASILMLIIVLIVKNYFSISILNLILLVFVGVVSYFICLVLMRDSLLFEVLKSGFNRIVKNKR